ncbi:carboxypeptidase regulatory-like domain-containing protein [uncultured Thiodictyon sp.]|uniref:carboxypeptidase regulatory-like domain-containing protein n=1 Tax=uncultured Thiodictyon sp. TaxID=1846217 RepID=UPI0025D901B8|nr:carboxypeptidase regulatory-like domain-containing protein [uncultured Thiodictyon sp.]
MNTALSPDVPVVMTPSRRPGLAWAVLAMCWLLLGTANATQAGSITGTVTAAGGGPLSGIGLSPSQWNPAANFWQVLPSLTSTAANGTYTLTGLAAGTYRVCFNDWSLGAYASQCYNNAGNLDTGADVIVTDAGTISGVDAQLVPAAHITGTVTNAAGGLAAGIQIQASTWSAASNGWQWARSSTTGPTGTYDIGGLSAGTYRICFSDMNGVYTSQCYSNASDVYGAMSLPVTAGQTVANINAQLASAAHITGIVTNANAVGLAGIQVQVQTSYGQNFWQPTINSTATGPNGAYDLGGLSAGTYRVCFSDPNGVYAYQCYNNANNVNGAVSLSVTAGQIVPNINAQLVPAAHITGTVTNASAVGLAGIQVQILTWDANQNFWQYASSNTSTGPNGTYDLGGLSAGTYRICFNDVSVVYTAQCYSNASDVNGAMSLPVTAGQTVANINAQLALAAHITGIVTSANAVGLAGIQVQVQTSFGQNLWQPTINSTSTGLNGIYDLGGLSAGTYRICFSDPNGVYASQCYNNANNVNGAVSLPVTAGQIVPSINAQLAPAAHITGTVTDASAMGLAGVQVQIQTWDANQNFWQYASSTVTGLNGAYDLGGLPAGTYRICFNDFTNVAYLSQCYSNPSEVNGSLPVTAGQTIANINAQLVLAGHVTGTVTAASHPVGGLTVQAQAWNAGTNFWDWMGNTFTAADGTYNLALGAGTYRICFGNWSGTSLYVTQCYSNVPTQSGGLDVTVAAGQTVPNINAQLALAGYVTGTVTVGGSPVGGLIVQAQTWNAGTSSWDWRGNTFTAADGTYNLTLGAGTYRVCFGNGNGSGSGNGGGSYAFQCYNNAPNQNSGTDVTVIAGQTVPNINAQLVSAGPATWLALPSRGGWRAILEY